MFCVVPRTMALEPHFFRKLNWGKWDWSPWILAFFHYRTRVFSQSSQMFSSNLCTIGIRIPCSRVTIFYYFYIHHKPKFRLFKQKNKPNHRVYKFQLNLMIFQNLHIVWTEGKNLHIVSLIRSLTTTAQDQKCFRRMEVPDSIKFFITHNQQTSLIQCHNKILTRLLQKLL